MNNIKVSIIMPSLNVVEYIEECIKSVISQSLKEIEIICIDAGSTDGTLEVIQKYAELDERIRIVSFGMKSYGAQVNRGIELANGEYVAIVETDDFINGDMYEYLYSVAVANQAEYVKADYKKVFKLKNGEYLYSSIQQFDEKNKEFYGKVINPHTFDLLYMTDFNIWRGIYKTDFLRKHHIKLNESKGAAYQDIGFMESVMVVASKAVYINKFFYNYRVDREEASSYSIYGLRNTKIEFQRLFELYEDKEDIYWRGFYLHMMVAFFYEYEKTLKKLNYNYLLPECSDYYEWFRKRIVAAIDNKKISIKDFKAKYVEKFKLLLNNPHEFALLSGSEKNRFREYVNDMLFEKQTELIIFGAGHWGYKALELLSNKHNCNVVMFVDNDTEKQGTLIEGIKIASLEQALFHYPKATYFIANEKYYNEIRIQIKSLCNNIEILCPFE